MARCIYIHSVHIFGLISVCIYLYLKSFSLIHIKLAYYRRLFNLMSPASIVSPSGQGAQNGYHVPSFCTTLSKEKHPVSRNCLCSLVSRSSDESLTQTNEILSRERPRHHPTSQKLTAQIYTPFVGPRSRAVCVAIQPCVCCFCIMIWVRCSVISL